MSCVYPFQPIFHHQWTSEKFIYFCPDPKNDPANINLTAKSLHREPLKLYQILRGGKPLLNLPNYGDFEISATANHDLIKLADKIDVLLHQKHILFIETDFIPFKDIDSSCNLRLKIYQSKEPIEVPTESKQHQQFMKRIRIYYPFMESCLIDEFSLQLTRLKA